MKFLGEESLRLSAATKSFLEERANLDQNVPHID